MINYTSGTVVSGLSSVPIPFGSGSFSTTSSYLSWFYQFPGKFADGLQLIFGISENGISILATVFVVCIIMTVLFHFTTTNHN